MAGIRPTQFPQLPTLSGGEEIYTQIDGGGNSKFTVQQVADFTQAQFAAAQVVETIAYKLPYLDASTGGGTIDWTKFYIPLPSEIHPDANSIEIKVIASVYMEFAGEGMTIEWYEPIAGTVAAIDNFTAPADGYIEMVKSGWIVPAHTGNEVQLKVTCLPIQSQADVLLLADSSIVLIRAIQVI